MVRVLQIHFGVALGCKGGGGKKKLFRSRKVFSGAGISNRAIGQIFHHARARKFFCLACIRLQRKRGENKN